MKNNTKIIISILYFFILGVTACSSNKNIIEAKYISIYDESSYLIFEKDGSFKNSLWNVSNSGTTTIDNNFIYTINEKNIITAIDTTEYEGQDSLNEYEIGVIYKNYICVSWNGAISKDYDDMSITNTLGEDLVLTFNLKKDKTYEFVVTSNGEVTDKEKGTYSISSDEVICTSNEGVTTTFVDIDGEVYCVEYVKE